MDNNSFLFFSLSFSVVISKITETKRNKSHIVVIIGRDLSKDAGLRVQMISLQDVGVVVALQDIHETASVPVVGDTAAIVDVTSSVLQNLRKSRQAMQRILV